MKVPTLQAALGTALVLASAQPTAAYSHGHNAHGHARAHQLFTRWHGQAHTSLHRSRAEQQSAVESGIEGTIKKRATCTLPDDPDLVAVPGDMNGGFAMAPNRACEDGQHCPYACKPGKVMAQWKEGSRIAVGSSMDGGLLCDGGVAKKPFKEKPMCVDGTGAVAAQNECGGIISFCQTVFPGDEGMRIKTDISSGSSETIAVPDFSYWQGTAAHFYVNPPGTPGKDGCIWGDPSKPVGNWAAYVAGANTVQDGNTFVTLGWNPEYTRDFPGKMPTYGLKIECDGSCVGAPCETSRTEFGGIVSNNGGQGDAGNKYCVVTVPKGSHAKIKVVSFDGSAAKSGGESKAKEADKSTASSAPPSTTTTSSAPPPPTTTTTVSVAPTTTSTLSSSSSSLSPSPSPSTIRGGIFHENGTETSMSGTGSSARPTSSTPTFNVPTKLPEPTTARNDGTQPRHGGAAVGGLVIAMVASLWMF